MAANGVPMEQIPDLIKTTLKHFKNRGKFEAVFQYQRYHFIDEVFERDKYSVQDGTAIQWTLSMGGNGTARHAGLYATRNQRNVVDTVKIGSQPWCYADAESYFHTFELKANRNASSIANTVKQRFFAGYIDLANLIEARAMQAPNDSSDTENPSGVPFWICMLGSGVTDPVGNFGGQTAIYGDGSTTTTTGALNRATSPLLRNWAATHTGMGSALMDTIRRGTVYANFKAPRNVKEMYYGPTKKLRILMSLAYQAEYARMVNLGPDNRNGDLSPFGTELNFMGIRVVGVPTLEGAAYNPVYCVDFGVFQPVVHSEFWMKESEPDTDINQRHVYVVGIDSWYNYICTNPRAAGFVVHNAR